MKKFLKLVVEQIEKHGEYIPFNLSEPVPTNSRK
jgi:hypothetical protein